MTKNKIYLTLQNGKSLQGYAFGAEGDISGELVFSTGMVGYIETLTDPSNYGKIVVQTFPLIGNYGMISTDVESDKAWVSAYVVREICEIPSNFRTEDTLESYLKEQGVIGIYGVDTRELTKILRKQGAMNARISSKPLTEEEIKALQTQKIENAVQAVAKHEKGYFAAENATRTLVLWDFGAKNSTIANLNAQGCNVVLMPANAKAEELLEIEADGIVLSDGPGDPAENTAIIDELKKLLGKRAIFGLGLGFEMLALAFGAKTKKHAYGHRGSNQPVKCTTCGKVFISTQNHGYVVASESVKDGKISFVNVNDGSCEGIDYTEFKAMGVEFAPEACSVGNPENPVYKKFFAMLQ